MSNCDHFRRYLENLRRRASIPKTNDKMEAWMGKQRSERNGQWTTSKEEERRQMRQTVKLWEEAYDLVPAVLP